MDRILLMNWDGLKGLLVNLGVPNKTFGLVDDTSDILVEILDKLVNDDQYCWEVHQQLTQLLFIEKQLWPVLKYVDGNDEVFQHAINIAQYLTTPVAPSALEEINQSCPGVRRNGDQLKKARMSFVDIDLAPVVFEHIFKMIEKDGDKLSPETLTCEVNCLKLFNNLMTLPEDRPRHEQSHLVVLSTLLKNGLVKFINHLVHSQSKEDMFLALSRFLHVMIKCDHGLQEFILPKHWKKEGDVILDYNESCMGSPESCDDSDSIKSSPRDDHKPEMPLNLENWISNTGWNGDGGFVKAVQLGRRQAPPGSESGDEDVSHSKVSKLSEDAESEKESEEPSLKTTVRESLKEFVLEFMKSEFSVLVETYLSVMTDRQKRLEFPTLEAYFTFLDDFIPYSKLVSWEHVQSAFRVETFSLLLYDGVSLTEEIQLREKEGRDLEPLNQRRYNCIQVWQKMVKCLSNLSSSLDSKPESFTELISCLQKLEQVCYFFVVMIRSFKPEKQNKKFLKSCVITNHRLLLLLENGVTFGLRAIIEQFATADMMEKYALLLQDFMENGEYLNNGLFTMMHHVAGDCNKLDVLVKPTTLYTLVQITEQKIPLSQVFEQLIDYVFDRFSTLLDDNLYDCAKVLSDEKETSVSSDEVFQDDCPPPWTELENTYLCVNYLQYYKDPDLINITQNKLADVKVFKSKSQILKQLQYMSLLEEDEFKKLEATLVEKTSPQSEQNLSQMSTEDAVSFCLRKLVSRNAMTMVSWLRKSLLEACYVRLGGKSLKSNGAYEESIPYVCQLLQEPIPLFPFTQQQEQILNDEYFTKLLETLDFIMPENSEMICPRIPHTWSPYDLYEKAMLLPSSHQVGSPEMKFTLEDLENAKSGVTQISDHFFDESTDEDILPTKFPLKQEKSWV